jgi:hypothetical protein
MSVSEHAIHLWLVWHLVPGACSIVILLRVVLRPIGVNHVMNSSSNIHCYWLLSLGCLCGIYEAQSACCKLATHTSSPCVSMFMPLAVLMPCMSGDTGAARDLLAHVCAYCDFLDNQITWVDVFDDQLNPTMSRCLLSVTVCWCSVLV